MFVTNGGGIGAGLTGLGSRWFVYIVVLLILFSLSCSSHKIYFILPSSTAVSPEPLASLSQAASSCPPPTTLHHIPLYGSGRLLCLSSRLQVFKSHNYHSNNFLPIAEL